MQRVEAAGDAHAVRGAGERGEALLELLDLGPQHVAPPGEHPREGRLELVGQLRVRGSQVQEGDPPGRLGGHARARASRANSS